MMSSCDSEGEGEKGRANLRSGIIARGKCSLWGVRYRRLDEEWAPYWE
jgi:hypothetical protein